VSDTFPRFGVRHVSPFRCQTPMSHRHIAHPTTWCLTPFAVLVSDTNFSTRSENDFARLTALSRRLQSRHTKSVASTSMPTDSEQSAETVEELRKSFFYGKRSNLNFKFVKDLSDKEFGDFIAELFDGTAALR